jgi:Protein kinase domain
MAVLRQQAGSGNGSLCRHTSTAVVQIYSKNRMARREKQSNSHQTTMPNASSTSAAASAASYAHAQPHPQLYSRQPQNLEVSYLQAQQQPQVPSQLYQRLDQPIVPLGGSGGSRTLLQSAEQIPANGGTSFRYRPRLSRGLDDQAMVKAGSANVSVTIGVVRSTWLTFPFLLLQSIATPVAPSPPPSGLPTDDKEGHFIVRAGDSITGRYKILSQLGQGTFGKVVEAFDRHDRKRVAIKVIRAIQKYRDASQIEIRVLRTLSENDPHNENQCIHLLSTFSYRNHVCIVSELLGKSVFDFLKENEFHPFPATHIWSFARQLLKSVACESCADCFV